MKRAAATMKAKIQQGTLSILQTIKIGTIIVTSLLYAKERTPLQHVTGKTSGISEYLDFMF